MQKPNYVYLAGLVLLSALLIAAIQWGPVATLVILALLIIFAIGYPGRYALLIWWRFRPIRKLTVGQDTGRIHARFESRWAKGKHTPYNATVLSFLYYRQKRYPEAEQYARTARDELKRRGLYGRSNSYLQWLSTDVAMRLSNALTSQNRLNEAAETMLEQVPYGKFPDTLTVMAAAAFYLGGDADRARAVLGDLKVDVSDSLTRQIVIGGPNPVAEAETDLKTPSSRLVTAWLRYKLYGEYPGLILQQHAGAIDSLIPQGEPEHDTDYERRWRDMCAEMRTLLAAQSDSVDQLR